MDSRLVSFDTLAVLTEGIFDSITDSVLFRGLKYYQDNRVVQMVYDQQQIIALVEGSDFYQVTIDFSDEFTDFQCNCPYDDYCKHIAATFFAYFSYYDDPTSLFGRQGYQKALAKIKKEGHAADVSTALLHKTTRTETVAAKPLSQLTSQSTVQDWLEYLGQQFQNLEGHPAEQLFRYGMDTWLPDRISAMFTLSVNWKRGPMLIYQTLVIIFAIRFLLRALARSNDVSSHQQSYYSYQVRGVMKTMMSDFDSLLKQIQPEHIQSLSIEDITKLAEFVRTISLDECVDGYTLLIYQSMWWQMFCGVLPVQGEIEALHPYTERSGISEAQVAIHVCACSFLYALTGQDDVARALLSTKGVIPKILATDPGRLFIFLGYFADSDDWQRAYDWLSWLSTFNTAFNPMDNHSLCQWWIAVSNHMDVGETCRDFLLRNLPNSQPYYLRYLLNKQLYKEWMNYQLLSHLSPLELDRDDLKEITKHDLTLVLPIYHQQVERYVLEKNRDSYKRAVRLLKKLAAHYKKLKQVAEWQDFVVAFSGKYTRFRALQEEMRKGGLIE